MKQDKQTLWDGDHSHFKAFKRRVWGTENELNKGQDKEQRQTSTNWYVGKRRRKLDSFLFSVMRHGEDRLAGAGTAGTNRDKPTSAKERVSSIPRMGPGSVRSET